MENNTVTPGQERLSLEDGFHFSCHKGLACFNMCCRDINLYLTPYDIVRMRRKLGISSADFLRTYTIPLFPDETGHPVILLKMLPDETKNCPFVHEDGCMIYADRPWSCRSFPLGPLDDGDAPGLEIIRRDFCKGFESGRHHTVRKWRDSQNLAFYEEMNRAWKRVTHHENFDRTSLLSGNGRDIFFLGSYNIDEFRNMVLKTDFLRHFDIDRKTVKNIRSSDSELLLLAFKWLRQVLFGEELLKRR